MTNSIRNIDQRFRCSRYLPQLTIRTTKNSTQGYKAHSHAELSVGVIVNGGTCSSVNGEKILLAQGDVILIEPELVHACNPLDGQPRSYHMLYIDNDWCCDLLSTLYKHKVNRFRCPREAISGSDESRRLSDLILAVLEHDTQHLAMQIEYELFNLISLYCTPVTHLSDDNALANQVRELLLQDPALSLSLASIAQQVGRPQETVIRIFKRHFGITPKSFLNNHRIEKAKLLLKSGMSIVDVAAEVGYSDQSQFHRAFVNYTASTPRQYQQGVSIFDNN